MKGRAGNAGGVPTDLLVCFPSRAHLSLMPKPICSPSRPADPTKRYLTRPTHRSQSSPLFRSKTGKHSAAADDISDEPTSPTVTCAGQIKVRPRSRPGPKPTTSSSRETKGWLSVVEEMEKLQSKKPLMQFLGALRSLRFDLHCFGSFHGAVDISSDEEEDGAEELEAEEEDKDSENSTASTTIFSKWLMLLEKNQKQSHELNKEEETKEREEEEIAPPPNALLLMRCRSAPAEERRSTTVIEQVEEDLGAHEILTQQEASKEKERLLLMSYDPNFVKLSTEISKETWLVGNFDPLARSRSWKR